VTRLATLPLLLVTVAWGCRCGDRTGPVTAGDGGPGEAWSTSWAADDLPGGDIEATLGGTSLDVVHVQVHLGQDATRIEILDRRPDEPCSLPAAAQGFSVKLPHGIDGDDRVEKSMEEHPHGWSAFMVTRGDDGSAVSSLARGWSFALAVSSLDEEGAEIQGRLALSFDDPEHSGAVGRFTGRLCIEPIATQGGP
jgi:hypothetical protein